MTSRFVDKDGKVLAKTRFSGLAYKFISFVINPTVTPSYNSAIHLLAHTSTLRDDLHWLPIRQRIMYKLSTIVYKCIHGAAPSYLTNLCVPVATNTSRRDLRSATHGDLPVPRTRTVTYGP